MQQVSIVPDTLILRSLSLFPACTYTYSLGVKPKEPTQSCRDSLLDVRFLTNFNAICNCTMVTSFL